MPVKVVATVDEYFFKIVSASTISTERLSLKKKGKKHAKYLQKKKKYLAVSERQKAHSNIPAYLKKNDESMPCAALLNIKNIVAFEWPSRILKLLGPVNV